MGKKGGSHAGRHQRRGDRPAGPDRRSTASGRPSHAGIVIHSNAPWSGTGYGVQTAALALNLKRQRSVTISCNFGLQGGISGWEGIEVLPTGFHPYSADILSAHTRYVAETTGTPTALLTLFDCWVYKNAKVDDIPLIASWVPIDHTPAPPDVLEWCKRDNVLPIAMAKYGQRMLEAAGIESRYAPHGVDTSTFKPGATVTNTTGRQLLNIPDDAYVVGVVAANKGTAPMRKAWGENMLALGRFMADHPDVWLYLHTEKKGAQGGADLPALLGACGIPDDRVVWVDQWAYYAGLGPDVLATLIGAFDVQLLCSRGEGFGVPVLEAAACGVPSIVSNFTAQPELVEGHGWTVTVQPYWDAAQSSWFCTPLVHDIVTKLETAYASDRAAHAAAARTFAESYDHRVVFERHWVPILDEIDERMAAA